MSPIACLIDPAPERAPLAALSALFSPLLHLVPPGKAPADARLTAIVPPLPEAEARQLARIVALLSGPDAAQQAEQVRELAQALLASTGEAESSGTVLRELRAGRGQEALPSSADPRLVRDLLLLVLTDQQAREEAELDAALDRIGAEENRMLARLRDDDNDDDDDLRSMESAETAAASALPRPEYAAAWLRVLARCDLPCARPWLITRNAALAQALLAQYRRDDLGEAVALPDLVLPEDLTQAKSACPPAAMEALTRLQEASSEEEARLLAQDCARSLADKASSTAPTPGLTRLELRVLPGLCLLGLCGPARPVAAAFMP